MSVEQWVNVESFECSEKDELGVNRTTLQFDVPTTTLKDHVAGRVVNSINMGPKSYLSNEEEKEQVEFLVECSKIGCRKTR